MRYLLIILIIMGWMTCAMAAPKYKTGYKHPATGRLSQVKETFERTTDSMGASYEDTNAVFTLYSKNATKVLLEIYAKPSGVVASYDYWMTKGSDNIWRVTVADVPNIVYYGFRLWGPNWTYNSNWARGNSGAGFICDVDSNGNRFNPNKVLYDPFAREISHDKSNPTVMGSTHNPGMFGTGDGLYQGIARRNFDTGLWAPKAILFANTGSDYGYKPNIPQEDAIIYEAHVRGLTKHPSASKLKTLTTSIPGMENVVDVPSAYRGTYKGAAYMAKYLKALGFNTVEFLPVHETDNDSNPTDSPGGNYWGYQTFSYFAPDRRYAYDKTAGGPTREFKEMVKAYHDLGMEVYLDVVYNHTGEGGIWDSTGKAADVVCFRGVDNAEYYAIPNGMPQAYWESTGCGNNLNASKEIVKKMVTDSLRYWATELGVDGFRFDLAPVLGRDILPNYDFNSYADLLIRIGNLHAETGAEMIAEAWDCQYPGGYQVGNFPFGWGEWNGKYRDGIRRFVKGGGMSTGFGDYFNGSYNMYQDQGGPHKSVNFVIAHDGFTLLDLVSYNGKNNKIEWPFGPSDGGNDNNDSWDHGGNTTLRRQQLRNFWTIQMFSRGVPMVVWGDEFGRTQNGNNNPYNIDSVATWNNYEMIATDSPNLVSTGGGGAYHNNFGTDLNADGKNTLFIFTKQLTNLRANHKSLRQNNYNIYYAFTKADGSGLDSSDRAVRVHIDGSSVGDSDFLVLINSWTDKVNFTLPNADSGKRWYRVIDTSSWAESCNNFWPSDTSSFSGIYGVNAWSIVVLQAR